MRFRLRRVATLCAAAAAVLVPATGGVAIGLARHTRGSTTGYSAGLQHTPTGKAVLRFAPADKVNFTGNVTDAVNLAKSYDLIADAGQMAGYLSQMRTANPDVTVLAAVEGALSSAPLATYPDAWHLHDKTGHPAQSGTGAYAMNPANADWVATVAATCSAWVNQRGYDGCTLTNLGTAPLQSAWKTGAPLNPATGRP